MTTRGAQITLAAALALFALDLTADQVCSVIPLNADTFANIGVALPKGSTFGGTQLSVRIMVPADAYSDCTAVGRQCAPPHSDASNVQPWAMKDVDDRAVYGNLLYNAKGAPTKWFRLCASYAAAGATLKAEDALDKTNSADPSRGVELKKLFPRSKPPKLSKEPAVQK